MGGRAKSSFSMLGNVPFWGCSSAAFCDEVALLLTSAVDEGGNVMLARLKFLNPSSF